MYMYITSSGRAAWGWETIWKDEKRGRAKSIGAARVLKQGVFVKEMGIRGCDVYLVYCNGAGVFISNAVVEAEINISSRLELISKFLIGPVRLDLSFNCVELRPK